MQGPDPAPGWNARPDSTFEEPNDEEVALVIRAINTERNLLVSLYAEVQTDTGTGWRPAQGFFDKPFVFPEGMFTIEQQVAALNRFEARLIGCECCYNNADDFEHYHSEVCYGPTINGWDYKHRGDFSGYFILIGSTDCLPIDFIPDMTGVYSRDVCMNPATQEV
jgi:hypothetical protein